MKTDTVNGNWKPKHSVLTISDNRLLQKANIMKHSHILSCALKFYQNKSTMRCVNRNGHPIPWFGQPLQKMGLHSGSVADEHLFSPFQLRSERRIQTDCPTQTFLSTRVAQVESG
jgi:hypothetical protein